MNMAWTREVLLSVLVAVGAFCYFSGYCDDSLFQSDAADYVRAVEGGMTASYLDTGSIGLWGTLNLLRTRPDTRAHLWAYFRQQRDMAAFRHFHVVSGFYPNVVAASLGLGNRGQRLMAAMAGAVAIGIVFLGLRLAGVHLLLALLSSILAVLSPALVSTASEVSPHPVFLAATLATAFAFARYLETGRRGWLFAVAAGLGVVVATLELSLVTVAALGAVAVWNYPRLKLVGLREAGRLVLVFLAVLLVLWPGGVIRGSYALSYGAFFYQALFDRGSYFGQASLGEVLLRGCQHSALVIGVVAVVLAGALGLFLRRKADAYTQVFFVLTLAFLGQGLLNRFHNPTYAVHFIVPAWILLGITAQRWLATTKGVARGALLAAVGAIVVVLGFAASEWPESNLQTMETQRAISERAREVLTVAGKRIPPGSVVLANTHPDIWGCYLPDSVVAISEDVSSLSPRPWESLPPNYWVIADTAALSTSWREWLQTKYPEMVRGYAIVHVGADGQ
jgi:hypothetical protein